MTALALVACGTSLQPVPRSAVAGEPVVAGFESLALDDPQGAVSVRFAQPVVDVEAVGPTLADPPVALEPLAAFEAHWSDRQTLVLRPSPEWTDGTRYRLRLTGALARARGVREHVFDALPPRYALYQHGRELRPRIELIFSDPVRAEDVVRGCALRDERGTRVALQPAREPRPSRSRYQTVALEPVSELARATRYALACSELRSPAHSAPFLDDDPEARVDTHGEFALHGSSPAQGRVLPPEQLQLCLAFTTPVDVEQLAAHVHVSPPPAAGDGRFVRAYCGAIPARDGYDPDAYQSTAVLLPDVEYTVRIDAELTDEYGQRLGRPHALSVRTGAREPGLWTASGMMAVLERGRAGHAVGTMNTSALQLRCARVAALASVRALDALGEWIEDYDGDEARDGFAQLGLVPRAQRIATPTARNAPGRWPLDLDGACSGAAHDAGLFLLELSAEPALDRGTPLSAAPAPHRLLANRTDLALVAKRGRLNAVVWVTRLSTGAPVAGARVRAFAADGTPLGSARSEHDGLARLELRAPVLDPDPYGDRGETHFLVETEDDAALVGTSSPWSDALADSEYAVTPYPSSEDRLVFVHADRGVYRPGETVLVHGLVRERLDRLPAVPSRGEVTVSLDPQVEPKLERTLPLSEFGAFHTELALPLAIAPGAYTLAVSTAHGWGHTELHVADYKPATFELRGGPERAVVLAGERIRVPIEARYLFDAPVADARVSWSVEREDASVHAPDFPAFEFRNSAPALEGAEERVRSNFDHSEQGRTDAAGRAQLELVAETDGAPARYVIHVWAQDRAHDGMSRAFELRVDSAERYVGTRFVAPSFAARESLHAQLVVIDRDGKPAAGDVELELRSEAQACGGPWGSCRDVTRTLERRTVAVGTRAPAAVSFAARTSGALHLVATVRDGTGRTASASTSTWVEGAALAADPDQEPVVMLETDKARYRAGERARLALRTPLRPARYLLTLERGDVLDARVVGAGAAQHALPLDVLTAPNAFVGMAGVVPRTGPGAAGKPRVVLGVSEVDVQAPTRALSVQARFEHERVRPGQAVRGEIAVSHLGVPVQAEVAVAVVQESVLLLTDFATPDPSALFHARRGLEVVTASNVPRVVDAPEEAEVSGRRAAVPQIRGSGVGANVAGGAPALRDEQPKVAFWAPALRSGPDGRLRFEFTAPGGLGAYRLMAVAAARDDRVGAGERRLTVQQPLAAQLVLPRFLSRGDRLELGALIHDHSGQPGAVSVQLRGRGLALRDAAFATAGTSRGSGDGAELVLSEAVAGDVDRAWFEVELSKHGERDRVGRELPVRRALDSELRVLQAGRARALSAELRWPAGIEREASELQLTVDRAGLAPLAPQLAAVLQYPYGCSEQTVAALGSLLAARELAAAIVPELAAQTALAARVSEAQSTLLAARTRDGHFALFPGMPGEPWLTALVLEGAFAARDAGQPVPDALLAGAAKALQRFVAHSALPQLKREMLATHALAVRLLARTGTPVTAAEEALWHERAALSDFARAQLLRAWAERDVHAARRAELIALLARETWLARDPGEREREAGSPLAAAPAVSAAVLHALVAARAPVAQQARLAHWLRARALEPDFHFSTRDTAWTLGALAAWAAQTEVGAGRVQIGHGSTLLWQGELRGAQVVDLRRSAAQVGDGTVWVKADGEVSIAIRRKDVSASSPRPAFSRGLSLQRRYLDPLSGQARTAIARGDVVQVVIALGVEQPVALLALSDPLPAGFEPLDPALTTGRAGKCPSCSGSRDFDYVRRRDDRVEAFARQLRRGSYTLRYLVRATSAGTFSAPGATAVAMYDPGPFARSAVSTLQVRR